MDQIPQDFIDTIRALTHNDNQVIKAAEEKFNSYKAQPDQLIGCLLFLVVHSTDQLLKDFSAVLVRPLLTPNEKNSLWDKISPATKDNVKTQLVELLKSNLSKSSRNKVVSIIASLSPSLISNNEWNLIPTLIEFAKSPVEQLRESSFLIVSKIVVEISSMISPHAALFAELIRGGLSDSSVFVQTASLSAISSFINIPAVDTSVFKPLLPLMITATTRAIEMNQEKSAQEAIIVFIIIAETKPNWITSSFEMVFKSFYDILVSEMVEEETRHYTLEFFITIAQKKPSTFKKQPQYLDMLIKVLYKWTSQIDEIPLDKWNQSTDDGDDENTDSNTGMDAFDRLASELPRVISDITFKSYIPHLLKSALWNERFAALMSIAMICEGAKDDLEKVLSAILQLILPLVNDPVPRVRWCLFFCLGQMANDFSDKLKDFYADLFRAVGVGASDPNPRVQGSVCLFLSTFLEDFKKDLILPHIDSLFTLIGPMMTSQYVYVAENALSAFSSIVECIEGDFKPYYDKFMKFLLDILQTKTSKPFRTLRGRAMEAISLIGLAVKKEVFAPHLHEIMNFISKQPAFESDDPQIDFFLRACTRFCQCLEKDFRPYIDFCMKPVMEAIKANVEIVTTSYGDDYAEDSVADTSSIAVENKSLALSLLVIYASVLSEELIAYVEPLMSETLKLIDYEFNEDIRGNAVELIPHLFRIANAHAIKTTPNGFTEFNKKLFEVVIDKLSESVMAESMPEIISDKLKTIGEIIDMSGAKYMSPTQTNQVFVTIRKVLEILDDLREDAEGYQDDEDDDPQGNFEVQYVDDAFNSAAIAIGDVLISLKQQSVTSLKETLLSDILERITSEKTSENIRSSMVCIIDDLIEHGGNEAGALYAHIIPPLIALCANSKDASVKHASAFGLGAAAQFGTQFFAPYIIDSLQAIKTCLRTPEQKVTEEVRSASDNAVSGMGRIITYCSALLAPHMATLVPLWISHLPIHDESEAPVVVENLIQVIKTNPNSITPKECVNIFKVFAEAEKNTYIKEDKLQDTKTIISQLKPVLDTVHLHLSADEKSSLEKLMSK